MQAALAPHPELPAQDAAGRRQPDKLDVTADARAVRRRPLAEYLPLFPGPYWHAGADEYLGVVSTLRTSIATRSSRPSPKRKHGTRANGKDAVLDFVNFVGGESVPRPRSCASGPTGPAAGSALRLDPRSSVRWWEERTWPHPPQLIAAGHWVLNAGWWPLYS